MRVMQDKRLQDMTLEELWELFPIVLSPHNPQWSVWAGEEMRSLSSLLVKYHPIISHIGSTAIPDIQAKPVVDILVEISPDIEWQSITDIFERNGYICMSESETCISFNKGYTPAGYTDKVFHVHVHRIGDNEEILFRDYLLNHLDTAKEYEKLKLSLLPEYRNNRDAYTDAKTEFVIKVLALAKQSKIWPSDTNRLSFRYWQEADAESLYKYASDSKVSEMALWPRHTSVEMSRQVIHDFFMPNEHTYAMVLKETGEPIGCIGLVPEGEEHNTTLPGEREVGYWIGFPYWGKGLTSEALKSMIEFCRNNIRLDSLLITTDAANKASQRVAEKCGFVNFTDYDNNGTPSKAFRLSLSSLAIRKVDDGKRDFIDLLLIGDESEDMIMKYLDRGNLYVGSMDNKDVAVIVTVEKDNGSVEIKNLAVDAAFRRRGIGRKMLVYVEKLYPDNKIILGTGETPSTLRFYRSCGYRYSYRISNFFTDNYPNPIVEEEVTLRDMVYLYKYSNKNDTEEHS